MLTHVKKHKVDVLLLDFGIFFVHSYRQSHRFVSGTFDLFDVICKQHCRTGLKPFLKCGKTVTVAFGVNKA